MCVLYIHINLFLQRDWWGGAAKGLTRGHI